MPSGPPTDPTCTAADRRGRYARRTQARAPAQSQGRVVRPRDTQAGLHPVAGHAPARHPVEEPRNVRGRGRHGVDHHLHGCQAAGLPEAPAGVGYLLALDFWLVATLLFANFASAIAEARGKAQADALRKTRRDHSGPPLPRRRRPSSRRSSTELRAGDRVEMVPARSSPATAKSSRA